MKKPLFVILILSLSLSACLPAFLQQQPATTNDNGQTPQVVPPTAASTATPTVSPIPTSIPPSKVVALSPTPTIPATIGPDILATATILTSSAAATVVTGTATTMPPNTPTQTPTINSGLATPTVTLHVRFYGTLPPSLPYGFITLRNKSKAEAYISLQCTTPDGYGTIMEYPVKGTFDVKVPAGRYTYVAWVGGKQMTGDFGLGQKQELIITLYKDKIGISK